MQYDQPLDSRDISLGVPHEHHSNVGWRLERSSNSLPEVFSTIPIPKGGGFWRTLLAYAGPGLMVAVGFMDPRHWAPHPSGGAQFRFMLLSLILISKFLSMFLQ